jgi:phage terminase small subunit
MAGRPRLPPAVAKATGAMVKDPQRFRDRKPPKVAALGSPPKHLDERQAEAWLMFAEEIPWLGAADRTILAAASILRAKMIAGDLSIGGMTELRQVLNALGATPAARSKVAAPQDDDDEDPADAYFN